MVNENDFIRKGVCPVCGGKLAKTEGCDECPACGWSSCADA